MQLASVTKLESPLIPNFLRIAGEVRFDWGEARTVWFDLPMQLEPTVSDRGEPWAVLLLPCAAVSGENLRLDLPVDPLLLYNLKGVQRVWQSWYPWVKPVSIEAPEVPQMVAGTDTVSFFSGGVDSYFSLLGPFSEADIVGIPRPGGLLTVWGFDIPLSKPDEFGRVRALAERAANHFNKELVLVATNLQELPGYREGLRWGELSHGAALASIGHLLSNRFRNILIGSTHDYSRLAPWGSHPLVDPQFSSAQTRIIHEGAASTRVEKTERICSVPEVAKALRVCWTSKGASNCSQCSKCLRTMVTFDLLGKQHLAESFDWTNYSLDRVGKVFLREKSDIDFALEIRDAAQRRGRRDIVRAIERSVRRSRRLRMVRTISRPVLTKLKKHPALWQYVDPMRRAFLGNRPSRPRLKAEISS